jgi:two-component system sensor histidine kinase BaeS
MRLKLIHKLLIALFASTALVLLLMVLFARASIGLGFQEFLAEQERDRIQAVVPELADWYAEHGNWDAFASDPQQFHQLLVDTVFDGRRASRPQTRDDRAARRPPPRPGARPGARPGQSAARRPPPDPQDVLQTRVFLLDANQRLVVGRPIRNRQALRLLPIELDGAVVGWAGVVPARGLFAPAEEAFLQRQRNALLAGLGVGLLVAALLAWLLARNLGRPVSAVAGGIRSLAAGDYSARVETGGHDEIARLGQDVNRLANALAEHEQARQRWMTDIAHELRTPLAIISGELEAMADGVRELNAGNLESVRDEARHLAALIDDLHSLALSDSGALDYRMNELDFATHANAAVNAAQPRAAGRGLDLTWQGPGAALTMSGDEQRLRQLLVNLLENAVRYTDASGIINVSLEATDGKAVLQVSDSKPGASAVECEQIFERLHRLEGSRNRNTGGSGLGLAICRNIVDAHGGQIRAEPGPLGGLLVTLELPLTP